MTLDGLSSEEVLKLNIPTECRLFTHLRTMEACEIANF